MQFNSIILFMVIAVISCNDIKKNKGETTNSVFSFKDSIDVDKLKLIPVEGLVYYNNQPFTGISVLRHNKTPVEITEYSLGKKNGVIQKYFEDGMVSYEAFYTDGKLNGKVSTWWGNGNIRSEAIYTNGVPNGTQKQWYSSGALFKEINLVDGKEEGLQRAWRENGTVYNNYEAKNGRIFGLKRANLCYELKDEEVQYEN